MADPLAAMFHKPVGGNIAKSELITSGHDTTVHKNYYNLNLGVSLPDVMSYIKTAAQPFVALTRMNPSTGMDSKASIPEPDAVEISNLIPPDPSALPVSSIADRYTRSMLECMVGYPLYEPEPFSQHSKEYLRNGVNVGDVGFVREDGSFDFLFNICPLHNYTINPPNLPGGFSLESPGHSETRPMRPLSRKTCFVPKTVTITESGEYICEGSEGAILELPEGAIQDEAINRGLFAGLAKLHGVEWYKYTVTQGRDISNGSLYLVTSFTKCTQWGIAVFDRRCHPGQGLTFVSSPLGWKGSRIFPTKVTDPNQSDTPNQCIFLLGYKIMIRQDIFDNLSNDQLPGSNVGMPSSSLQVGSSSLTLTRQRATRIRGGGGTDPMSGMSTGGNPLTHTTVPTMKKSDEVVLHANFNSSPAHPSDLINVALLSQYPDAKVALTHDDVWCDLLRDHFPKLNYMTLKNIARSYTSAIDEYGCVALENTNMFTDRQMKKGLSDGTSLRYTSIRQMKKELSDDAHQQMTRGDNYPTESADAAILGGSHSGSSRTRRRNPMACLLCHKRKIKCEFNIEPDVCDHCRSKNTKCTIMSTAQEEALKAWGYTDEYLACMSNAELELLQRWLPRQSPRSNEHTELPLSAWVLTANHASSTDSAAVPIYIPQPRVHVHHQSPFYQNYPVYTSPSPVHPGPYQIPATGSASASHHTMDYHHQVQQLHPNIAHSMTVQSQDHVNYLGQTTHPLQAAQQVSQGQTTQSQYGVYPATGVPGST